MKGVVLPETSEESLATILEIISDGIWDWNANTNYVYRSPGWYTMLGYDINELENTVFTWESIIHPGDYDRVMDHFNAYITRQSGEYKILYRCRTKAGTYLWIEDRGKAVKWNDDGSIARMIGAHRDIHKEQLLNEENEKISLSLKKLVDERTKELLKANKLLESKVSEAKRLATTDTLTGLGNRYSFDKRLTTELSRAKRFKEPLSLIVLDLDGFKEVNDTYGHTTGDLVLTTVAQIIRSNVREIDFSVRWGGDEFMIILPNTPVLQAEQVANKLLTTISEENSNTHLDITASFGVSELKDDDDAEQLTVRADKALLDSKRTGRNKITVR